MQHNSKNVVAASDYRDLFDDHQPAIRNLSVPPLEQIWQTIKNNKLLIGSLLIASLLIGLIITLLMTPMYKATTRIEISRAKENVTSVEGVDTSDKVLDLQYYQTQYELLSSRSLAEQVIRKSNLTSNKRFLKAYDIEVLPDDPEKFIASILLANVSIKPIETSNLVDIEYTSADPVVSSGIANAWAREYIASNLNRRFGATSEGRKFLEGRLAQLRERLENAERDLINYAARRNLFTIDIPKEGNSDTTASQTLVASDLQALNDALTNATTARLAAQSALRAAGNPTNPADAAAIQPLRQKRAELAAERARLRATAGDEYPSVIALTDQVTQLDREISSAESRLGSDVKARYLQAAELENRLRLRVDELRKEFVQQRRDSVQYNILQREVDTNRALYNAILQRYREIGVAGVGENNISVVDSAEVPDSPSSPNLPLNLLLSLLIGAASAGGIILLRERLDQSVREPAEVPELLGVPLLGSIPFVGGRGIDRALSKKDSELYEAYVNLCTNLGFLSDQGVPKLIMVGSSRPAEGKSLSSVALANVLTERGKRVLLLDADMRNSGVFKYLEIQNNRKGLSNLLSGEKLSPDMIGKGTPFSFDILSAGRRPPNAAELLTGERFATLLQTLATSYDHVVIDGPPVLGLADAPLIAAAVDGVVMVIEANHGKIRLIAQALNRLEHGGGKIFGAIVTKLDQRNTTYGYGSDYGYGYSYGDKEQPDEET